MESGSKGSEKRWTPTISAFADLLAASNRAIIYERDRIRLVEEVCRIAVEMGGFRMAWVGLVEPDSERISVAAHFGVSADYLENIQIALGSDSPEGRGPTGTAIRERRPVICQDIETDPKMEPWREAARSAGFRASAALPLIVGFDVIGALSVYAPTEGSFEESVMEPLEELAGNMAFGLQALEAIEKGRIAEAEALHRQHELETLFKAMQEAVVVLDSDLRIVDMNRAFVELVGHPRDSLIGAEPPWPGWTDQDLGMFERIKEVLTGEDFTVRASLPRVDGPPYTADLTVTAIREEDRETRLVCTIHDVTELESARSEAVGSRNYLEAAAGAMVEGMYVVDRDGNIRFINDAAADMLGWGRSQLVGLNAHEAFHSRRPDGTAYPISECPVAICSRNLRPIEGVRESFLRRDGSRLGVIISAAPFEVGDETAGTVVIFEDADKLIAEETRIERELAELSWVGRVRDALAEDRFVLYAQPIVEADSGEIVQHELLLRLRLPDDTIVPPGEFLPPAEKYGLMADIDKWVAGQAAAIAARGIPVEFNLSAAALTNSSVIRAFDDALIKNGADSNLIVVEVTETGLVEARAAARRGLEQIRGLGCRIAIDDFGTGYGGLTYVKDFPIDILKIDIEFVRDALVNKESEAVVRAVVALADGLGRETVAEGVEDAATLELMRELGVTHAQGYHLGRPAPVEQLLENGETGTA